MRSWCPNLGLMSVTLFFKLTVLELLLLNISLHTTLVSLFHSGLVTLLCSMANEFNHTVSLWTFIPNSASLTRSSLVSDIFHNSISLNNFFVEYTSPILSNSLAPEWFWNIVWSSSSVENHSFTHPTSAYYSSQELYSGTDLTPYLITVTDAAVIATAFLYAVLFIYLVKLVSLKYKIAL